MKNTFGNMTDDELDAMASRLHFLSEKYKNVFARENCPFAVEIKNAIELGLNSCDLPVEYDSETGYSTQDYNRHRLYNDLIDNYDFENNPFYHDECHNNFYEVMLYSGAPEEWLTMTDQELCVLTINYWVKIELQNLINHYEDSKLYGYDESMAA